MSYARVVDIEARTPQYTSSGSFGSSTRPTQTQVETFLEEVSAVLDVVLAEQGFAIPVTAERVKPLLRIFVADEAAALVEGVNRAGRFAPGNEELRGQSRFILVMRDAVEFIEKHAEGLEQLGATRTRIQADGLAWRQYDNDSDTIVGPFDWHQFSDNNVIDWDPA